MIHPPLSWKKTLVALMDYSKKLKIKNDLNLERPIYLANLSMYSLGAHLIVPRPQP